MKDVNFKEVPLTEKKVFTYDDLIEIIKTLRGENGCPWDKKQTHKSIRINLIEEAYELVDAIDKNDDSLMLEEIGDVLLQSAFHSVIGEERNAFTSDKVISNLCKKLISRHTHIFNGEKAENEAAALNIWEKNKIVEKNQDTFSKTLEDLPKNLPSCLYAEKMQKRVAKSGFDFPNYNQAIDKIHEELGEFIEQIDNTDGNDNLFEEAGDLLFSVVNLLRMFKIDSEIALKQSTYKFKERFTEMEKMVLNAGEKMQNLTIEQLNGFYDEAKKNKNKEY